MSTPSAKSSIHKRFGNAAKKGAFLAYPFLVFGWLALASARERRLLCIAALCALLVFLGTKILKNRRTQRLALRELLAPALAGTLLLAVLLSGNEHFFKLYPILISAAALAYFAHSLAFPPNVVEKIARRIDRDFSPEAVPYTRKVALAWCAFFALNIAASAASALLSWEIWCFYNGFLSYCMMGGLFVGEFFVRKRVKNHLKTGFVRPSLLLAEGARVYENEHRSRAAFMGKNGVEISFPQFCGKVARLAQILRERKETHCAISCDDAACFSLGFFAALCAGKKILLPQSLRVGILAAIEKFDPVFLSEKTLPRGAVPAEKFIRVDFPFATETQPARGNEAVILPELDRASKITFFSSGSTGTPKEIRKTWANIEDEILRLNAFLPAFPRTGAARVLATVKCGHLYGLLYACLLPLCRGASVDAERIAFPEELAARSAPEAEEALWLVSTPAFLSVLAQDSALLKTVFKEKSATAGAGLILSSASPLARETSLQIFDACGLAPLEVYGTTEIGGIAHRRQTETQNWTRWPDVEISLRGDACELCVRTPLAPDFSTPVPVGDAAEIFPDGKTFRLLGRTNRLVKFQDNRLSLDEVEQTLAASPLVAESFFSVYENSAAPGATTSAQKTLCALVVLSPEGRDFALGKGVPALSVALKNFLRSRVEPFAVPKKWRYTTAIPRNEQSKILAEEIRALFSTKLQEPLVENLQLEENSVRAQLTFLPGAVYFRGHFPSLPLLPGVVQLYFAEHFAKKYLRLDVAGTPVSRLKFKAPIFPARAVQIFIEKMPDSRVKFSFSRGARLCSSGYFNLSEK